MLTPDFSVLFFQIMERDTAFPLPWEKSGDSLALAPLPFAVLSVVMQVSMISSKQGAVLLPSDLLGVLHKGTILLDPKIPGR